MGTRTSLKTVVMGVTAAALLAVMFSYSPLQTGSQKDPGAKPGTTPEIDGFTLVKGKKAGPKADSNDRSETTADSRLH